MLKSYYGVIIFFVVSVYLPLGYPVVQGAPFSTVVYNGTVARLYSLPSDPRTGSQLFERYLMSDVARMRGVAGTWAKAVWRLQFGTRYTQVIYQLVRGDVDGLWSAGRDIYRSMSSDGKSEWRVNAPYQATYNDPGEIFFALNYVLYQWSVLNNQNYYFQPDPVAADVNDLSDVVLWWTTDLSVYGFQKGRLSGEVIENYDVGWSKSGTWSREYNASHSGGSAEITSEVGAKMMKVVNCSRFAFRYSRGSDGGVVGVYVSGQNVGSVNQYSAVSEYGLDWLDVRRKTQNYLIEFRHGGPSSRAIRVDAIVVYRDYRFVDIPYVSGTWVLHQNLGQGVEVYKTSGRVGSLSFVMVGSYFALSSPVGPGFGTMRVYVDGDIVGHLFLNAGSAGYTPLNVFGRFKKTVHFVKLEALGDGEIGIDRIVVGYRLSDVGG